MLYIHSHRYWRVHYSLATAFNSVNNCNYCSKGPGRVQSTVMCNYVCLSNRISQKPHCQTSPNFLYMLSVTVAHSSSGGTAISYVFSVLWMTYQLKFSHNALWNIVCIPKWWEHSITAVTTASIPVLLNDKKQQILIVGCELGMKCAIFTYVVIASVDFSFFSISILFHSLTASATSSFHHHVSLCLHEPLDNPHVTCAVSIIIFFICCQCLFTSRYFHSASTTLSLTTSFPPWASIHALLVQTSYAMILLY